MASNNRFRIHGIPPDGTDKEWNGCGWGEVGRGRKYSDVESWLLEREINRSGFVACWRIEAK